jgi:ADP-ribose pyrophosphatase YjhB (NUDIX family)
MSGSDLPVVGVGAVIFRDGRLLIVKRSKDPGRGLWAVPGGKVLRGETLRSAVQREVAEETSLQVEVGDVAWVGEVIEPDHHLVLIDFHARVTGGIPAAGDDAAELAWLAPGERDGYELTPTMYDLLETLGYGV